MDVINEEWVSLWYQCLFANIDYQSYCTAIEKGDTKRQSELEAKFVYLKEIYRDFGDVGAWPEDGLESKTWNEWFTPRKHLFIPTAISVVPEGTTHNVLKNHLLIDVLLSESVETTKKNFSIFITDFYKKNKEQLTLAPSSSLKYSLFTNEKGGVKHSLKMVRKVCASTARSYRYYSADSEEIGYRESMLQFIKNEMGHMGWTYSTFNKEDRKTLLMTGRLREEVFLNLSITINRARDQFKAMSANTIRGRFPDLSPYESEVLNYF